MIPTDLAISIQNYLKPKDLNINNFVSPIALPNTMQVVNSLQNWQVQIAENRLFVVRYVQEQVRSGRKKTNVIEQMIVDADAGTLLPAILEAIVKANAKAGDKRTVSRRSVFDWIKAVEDAELPSVAADEVAVELVAAELAALETCSVVASELAAVSAEALTLANTKPAAKANVVAPA